MGILSDEFMKRIRLIVWIYSQHIIKRLGPNVCPDANPMLG
jgi:hypothetical protein